MKLALSFLLLVSLFFSLSLSQPYQWNDTRYAPAFANSSYWQEQLWVQKHRWGIQTRLLRPELPSNANNLTICASCASTSSSLKNLGLLLNDSSIIDLCPPNFRGYYCVYDLSGKEWCQYTIDPVNSTHCHEFNSSAFDLVRVGLLIRNPDIVGNITTGFYFNFFVDNVTQFSNFYYNPTDSFNFGNPSIGYYFSGTYTCTDYYIGGRLENPLSQNIRCFYLSGPGQYYWFFDNSGALFRPSLYLSLFISFILTRFL